MTIRMLILSTIILSAFGLTDAANAEVRQVGPQSFHKRLEIPHRIGRSDAFNSNNADGYNGQDARNQKRMNRRMKRLQERKAATEEARTQSDKSATNKRKGRRDKQRENSRPRLRQQQQGPISNNGVND